MPETQTEERDRTLLAIPRVLERSAGDVVHQAFDRLLSSDTAVTTAAEARRLLADHEETEELTDAIQRFVGIATPVVRIALRGARFTRIPWVLVASSAVSIGVTVRNGVRELQAIAALLVHRFEEETGAPPDRALLQKLTLELYLRPRRTPDVSDLGLPLVRLARRWIVSGAFGRNTRGKTEKALDAAERLDVSSLAGRALDQHCVGSTRDGLTRLASLFDLRLVRVRTTMPSDAPNERNENEGSEIADGSNYRVTDDPGRKSPMVRTTGTKMRIAPRSPTARTTKFKTSQATRSLTARTTATRHKRRARSALSGGLDVLGRENHRRHLFLRGSLSLTMTSTSVTRTLARGTAMITANPPKTTPTRVTETSTTSGESPTECPSTRGMIR